MRSYTFASHLYVFRSMLERYAHLSIISRRIYDVCLSSSGSPHMHVCAVECIRVIIIITIIIVINARFFILLSINSRLCRFMEHRFVLKRLNTFMRTDLFVVCSRFHCSAHSFNYPRTCANPPSSFNSRWIHIRFW